MALLTLLIAKFEKDNLETWRMNIRNVNFDKKVKKEKENLIEGT